MTRLCVSIVFVGFLASAWGQNFLQQGQGQEQEGQVDRQIRSKSDTETAIRKLDHMCSFGEAKEAILISETKISLDHYKKNAKEFWPAVLRLSCEKEAVWTKIIRTKKETEQYVNMSSKTCRATLYHYQKIELRDYMKKEKSFWPLTLSVKCHVPLPQDVCSWDPSTWVRCIKTYLHHVKAISSKLLNMLGLNEGKGKQRPEQCIVDSERDKRYFKDHHHGDGHGHGEKDHLPDHDGDGDHDEDDHHHPNSKDDHTHDHNGDGEHDHDDHHHDHDHDGDGDHDHDDHHHDDSHDKNVTDRDGDGDHDHADHHFGHNHGSDGHGIKQYEFYYHFHGCDLRRKYERFHGKQDEHGDRNHLYDPNRDGYHTHDDHHFRDNDGDGDHDHDDHHHPNGGDNHTEDLNGDGEHDHADHHEGHNH